ncbi:MAG: transaldolase family protein [Synechococcales bacterium]|nr:transaldolase family protein [Synechococcales bacterium]
MTAAILPTATFRRSDIRLFLDTADVSQWSNLLPTGIFYGVTTNPTLLERAQVPCDLPALSKLTQTALQMGAQEVQIQTWGETLEAMVTTGRRLANISDRVVVKVPITQAGTTAAARLVAAGVRITLTAVYAHPQVLIGAGLGADYVAPYLGRMTDAGKDGRAELVAMQQSLTGVRSTTRILVASIRALEDVAFLTTQGLDTFTLAPAIAQALFEVPETNAAAIAFEQAAQRMGARSDGVGNG